MENQDCYLEEQLPQQAVFALDIGTHSIIGMVGFAENDRIHVVAIEQMEHTKRAMIDGQIQDISQVAKIAGAVKDKLEKRLGCRLTRVAVAAAGRALRTAMATYEMELSTVERISPETISRLEAGAIDAAEKAFAGENDGDPEQRFYLVGYSASRYYLDDYTFSSLVDHRGKKLKVDIIATFLPSEVVESLYAAMNKINLEVASLTLEPIAAINAAIPPSIRLLNLAMVDIGAGTSDIAVCRDGSITGYTMAVQAGDEITETIMKDYLVDFQEAERIKSQADASEPIVFTDIMGFEQTITRQQLLESIKDASASLCNEICSKIVETNAGAPSAVFLAGGGSLLSGLKERIAEKLQIDPKRIAIAGRNFKENAFSEEYDLDNPEYTTPIGIMVSAGLNMINDSFRVILNGHQAKLFRSGTFTVMDILMMNGYSYQDMMGKSGQNLGISLNGQRKLIFGEKAEPCVLRLNGQETRMSALVRAGDRIDFIPARRGQDASARLSQLVSIESGRNISVNGEPVTSDIDLKSGDIILVDDMSQTSEDNGTLGAESQKDPENANHDSAHETSSTADQESENMKEAGDTSKSKQKRPSRNTGRNKTPIAKEMTETARMESVQMELPLDGLGKEPDAPLVSKKKRTSSSAGGKKVSSTSSAEKKEASATAARRKKGTAESAFRRIEGLGAPEPVSQEAEVVNRAEPVSPEAEESDMETSQVLMLYLNDQPLLLPPKPDGQPYYLMDMLQHSGLDLKNLTNPVELEVNGENGAFQAELKSGDKIKICEKTSGI